jgi:hypothetical protein
METKFKIGTMALARPSYGHCLASGASFTWTLPSHWRVPHTQKIGYFHIILKKIRTLAKKIVTEAVQK